LAESNIANVYAQALFEAARGAGTLEATAADLESFAGAMRESRELTAVMFNPRIDSATKKDVIGQLTEGGDRIFVNGVKLLIDKRHADLVFAVQERFHKLLKDEQDVVEVEITSAIELPEETRAGIRQRIEASIGKKVDIKETVRADIIGGLVLRFGDVIVDGSLKARLAQLRARLVQANLGSE